MGEAEKGRRLETVYAEASDWVRMCNTLTWSMGALLVPVSVGVLAWR
jgi:hypothetical protein